MPGFTISYDGGGARESFNWPWTTEEMARLIEYAKYAYPWTDPDTGEVQSPTIHQALLGHAHGIVKGTADNIARYEQALANQAVVVPPPIVVGPPGASGTPTQEKK